MHRTPVYYGLRSTQRFKGALKDALKGALSCICKIGAHKLQLHTFTPSHQLSSKQLNTYQHHKVLYTLYDLECSCFSNACPYVVAKAKDGQLVPYRGRDPLVANADTFTLNNFMYVSLDLSSEHGNTLIQDKSSSLSHPFERQVLALLACLV